MPVLNLLDRKLLLLNLDLLLDRAELLQLHILIVHQLGHAFLIDCVDLIFNGVNLLAIIYLIIPLPTVDSQKGSFELLA